MMLDIHKFYPEFAALIAALLWSTSALSLVSLNQVPVFLLLATFLTCNFLVMAGRLTWRHKWRSVSMNKVLWFAGVLGLFGNDLFYYLALRFTPVVLVEMISWFWPIILMLYVTRLRLTAVGWCSLLLSLFGVVLLNNISHHLDFNHLPYAFLGEILAFSSALTWVGYTVVTSRFKSVPQEMVGLYAGIGALAAWGLHFCLEPHSSISHHDYILIAWVAVGPTTLAYYAWDYAVSFGDVCRVARISYLVPALSFLWLVIFGKVLFTIEQGLAVGLLTAAILLPEVFEHSKSKVA